jgi:hypothetical protein
METDFERTWVISRQADVLIDIRRHLERISCGIPAESGSDRASPEKREPPDQRVNQGVSSNAGYQTS